MKKQKIPNNLIFVVLGYTAYQLFSSGVANVSFSIRKRKDVGYLELEDIDEIKQINVELKIDLNCEYSPEFVKCIRVFMNHPSLVDKIKQFSLVNHLYEKKNLLKDDGFEAEDFYGNVKDVSVKFHPAEALLRIPNKTNIETLWLDFIQFIRYIQLDNSDNKCFKNTTTLKFFKNEKFIDRECDPMAVLEIKEFPSFEEFSACFPSLKKIQMYLQYFERPSGEGGLFNTYHILIFGWIDFLKKQKKLQILEIQLFMSDSLAVEIYRGKRPWSSDLKQFYSDIIGFSFLRVFSVLDSYLMQHLSFSSRDIYYFQSNIFRYTLSTNLCFQKDHALSFKWRKINRKKKWIIAMAKLRKLPKECLRKIYSEYM